MSKRLRNIVSIFAVSLAIWAGIISGLTSVYSTLSEHRNRAAVAELSTFIDQRIGGLGVVR